MFGFNFKIDVRSTKDKGEGCRLEMVVGFRLLVALGWCPYHLIIHHFFGFKDKPFSFSSFFYFILIIPTHT